MTVPKVELNRRQAIQLAFVSAAGAAVMRSAPGDAPAREVLYYGSEQPLPRQIPLRAGPLTMVFEPELAQLRYIRLGDREVVRAIYAAVRDRNWGTVEPRIAKLRTETTDGAFRVDFDVACREGDIDFLWHGIITGDPQGQVKFQFDGEARSTFLRNRLGFCVLHPVEGCAGEPITVEKTDGSVQRGRFPDAISPHQPFMEIRAIRHTAARGVEAEVRFEGDVFEMEDHRNWTDASYKTYCTPLALPFPVEVKQGSRVRQSITMRLSGEAARPAAVMRAPELTIEIDEGKPVALPRLGLGMASHSVPLTATEKQRLRTLNLSHLRVDVDPGNTSWSSALERAISEASDLGAALEVALKLGHNAGAELEKFTGLLRQRKPRVSHYLIFHKDEKSTTGKWMDLARAAITRVDPSAKIASGTDAYFTELNRERPPVDKSDLVCYSINPQVHAFDNMSLVETLEMQAATLNSARRFCGSLPIAVTPVTLKPRFNPNATAAASESGGAARRLPDQVDVRQMSLFGAAWTVGSLKYLAEGGAASATYYETTGWRGVMETERGSPLPAQFRSTPGTVFPIYHVLADVGEFAGGDVLMSRSSNALVAEALVLRKGSRKRILIANLSPQLQLARLPKAGMGKTVRVSWLDARTAADAMANPESFRGRPARFQETGPDGVVEVPLTPYAVARIDSDKLV